MKTPLSNITTQTAEQLEQIKESIREQLDHCNFVEGGFNTIYIQLIDDFSNTVKGHIDHHPMITKCLVTGLDYSSALRWAKAGHRIARSGWNGKGMWVIAIYEPLTAPYMSMCTADGSMQKGWLPSQPDNFAMDWVVLYETKTDKEDNKNVTCYQ